MSFPSIYTDDNGARVIVRHRGPAGPGVPNGGTTGQILIKSSADDYDTEWSTNPALATGVTSAAGGANNEVALYAGADRTIKRSNVLLADLATAAALAGKVDTDGAKVLTDVNFTQALATKLGALTERYRGSYGSLALLNAGVPAPVPGDYAVISTSPPSFAYCAVNVWTELQMDMTAEDISELVFDADDVLANTPGGTWDEDNCRIFTTADKDALASLTQILAGALGPGASVTPFRTVDADYLITAADRTVDVTANSPTITLPTALTNVGSVFTIKNSGAGTVTVNCTVAGEEIDGDASLDLDQFESVTVQSTGTGRGYIII